jgi:hypothetical protein
MTSGKFSSIIHTCGSLGLWAWICMFGPTWLVLASIVFWLGVVAIMVHLDKIKSLAGTDRLKALHLAHEYQPDNADWTPRRVH